MTYIDDIIRKVNENSVWSKTAEYNKLLKPNYEFVYEKVTSFLEPKSRIIDVGAAYGVLSIALRGLGHEVTAIDNTDRYTNRELLKEKDIKFFIYDIEKHEETNFKDFDLVVFTEVLEHLNNNPLKPMKLLCSMLKKGGRIILTTPRFEVHGFAPGRWGKLLNWKLIPEKDKKYEDTHTHHYQQGELVSLLDEAGFEIEEIGDCYNELSHYVVAKRK